ncbi:MAG: preprotein translocase subunit YajC [Deltaproteobacteria bacterium]|nr:preprotein translocase subunit YajC [Deltaproteobacteria bacterium]
MFSSIPTLLAQAADGAGGPPGCGGVNMIPILLMFAVVYFLILRPQSKQAREHQNLLGALKKGDEVVTQGGIVGKVFAVQDHLVTLEIARDTRIRILKTNISSLYTSPAAEADGE